VATAVVVSVEVFACPECGGTHSDVEDAARCCWSSNATGVDVWECDSCDARFESEVEAKAHCRSEPIRGYNCADCAEFYADVDFDGADGAEMAAKACCGDTDGNEVEYKCDECLTRYRKQHEAVLCCTKIAAVPMFQCGNCEYLTEDKTEATLCCL
jgi:hypothetical protein